MSIYRKENISKYLSRAFYLFGIATDSEAIQLSYISGIIKALITQLNNRTKMPAVDV